MASDAVFSGEREIQLSTSPAAGEHWFRWQFLLIALLFVEAIVAATLKPPDYVFTVGVWAGSPQQDPLVDLRAGLIASGLILPCVDLVVGLVEPGSRSLGDWVARLQLTSLAFAIGFALMPYLANGVFRSDWGNGPCPDLDPKALMPMIWPVGPSWSAAVLWSLLLMPAAGALSLWTALSGRASRREKRLLLASTAATVVAFVACFGALGWLVD